MKAMYGGKPQLMAYVVVAQALKAAKPVFPDRADPHYKQLKSVYHLELAAWERAVDEIVSACGRQDKGRNFNRDQFLDQSGYPQRVARRPRAAKP